MTAQQDCCTAIPLLGPIPVTVPSNSGNGNFEELNSCSCLATNEHDAYWFSFECTSSGTFEMMIVPDMLSADFDFALYGDECPCGTNTTVVSCDYSGPITPPGPFVETGISSTPMATFGVPGLTEWQPTVNITAGVTYYIISDNITTNGAGFEIQFAGSAGIGPPAFTGPPPPPEPLTGDATSCPGATTNYLVPVDPTISEYIWTVDPSGPTINENRLSTVDITWNATGLYTVCVEADAGCGNVSPPNCIPVLVMNIVTIPVTDTICLGETYEAPDGQFFFGPGVYDMFFTSYQGCDSIVQLILNPALPAFTVLVEEICDGDCFEFAGEQRCATGIYEEVLETVQGCDSTVTLNLIIVPNMAVIDGSGSISCNGDTVLLDGGFSIGGNNMTFEWTDDNGDVVGTDQELEVTEPGDYTLTITSEVGMNICVSDTTTTVDANNDPPENVTAVGGTITCAMPSITLSGNSSSPDVTYDWDGPGGFMSNEQNPTASSTGTYTLTITATNGCTATATAEVDGDSGIPDVMAEGDTLDCNNNTITLTGNSTTSGVTYSWSGPNSYTSTEQNPNANDSGTYTLTVTAPNGCSAQALALVEQDSIAPDAMAIGGEIDCMNNSLTLMGSSNTPGVNYSWTGPNSFTSNEQNPTANAGGTYTLTVTATNGCTSTSTALVEQNADIPDASAVGGDLDCAITTITLMGNSTTAGVTFSWVGPNSFSSDEQNPDVDEPGTYTLTVTATNGCTATATANVTQDIAVPDASATGGTVTCTTGSVVLNGNSTTPNVTYSWTGPGGNIFNEQNPMVSEIGVYTLTVTATNGCTATATADVLQDAGVPDVSATGDTLNCIVNSVTVFGNSNTAGVTYEWTGPNSFTSTLTSEVVTVAGNYVLTVTAPNNCTAQATAVVVLDNGLPDFEVDGGGLNCDTTAIILSSTINTVGSTFEWTGPGGFVSNASNPSVTQAGNYTLTVLGPNGCSDAADAIVSEDIIEPDVSASGGTIDCNLPDVLLDGGSTTAGVVFEWSGPAGFMADIQDTAVVVAGDYVLTVTAMNGCTASSTVTVIEDLAPPADVNATGGILSCNDPILALLGSTSSPNVDYFWTGPGGFFSDELGPTISLPGSYVLTVTGANGCQATDQAIVGEDANIPEAIAAGGTLTCFEPTIQISGTSMTQGASFSWTGPSGFISDQQNPDVTNSGTYTLTVTAPNGCTSTATAMVDDDIDVPQNVSVTGGTLNCLSLSLILTGSSSTQNVTYAWTGPNGFVSDEQNPEITISGDYILVVTSLNGCTATSTAQVVDDSNAPTATANDGEVTCDDPTVNLNGQSSTSNSTFSWVGPGGFTSDLASPPSIITAGTFTLTVTAPNGCTGTVDAEVTVNNTSPDISVGGGLITCQDPIVTLQGNSSTPGVTFEWTGPGGFISDQQNPDVNVGGDYILTVTAANGCTANATAVVDLDADVPTATAEGGTITCVNASVGLLGGSNQPGVTWEWTGPNGFTSDQQNPIVTELGLYTLTITTGNGCSASANAQVDEQVDLPVVNIAAPDLLTCANETSILDATNSDSGPGFTLNWTTANGNFVSGTNTLSPEVNEAGIYSLEITNQNNGCVANAEIEVEASNDIPSAVTLQVSNITCFGYDDAAIVVENVEGGTPPYLYALGGQPFGTINVFTGLAPGTYELKVQDSFGCEYTESFTIDQPAELTASLNAIGLVGGIVPLGESIELAVGLNISTSEVASVTWLPDGIAVGCADPCLALTLTPGNSTNYEVTVVDSNGCLASAEILIPVDKTRPVFVPNAFSPNDDGINDQLVVFGGNSVTNIKSFLVFSRWGESIFEVYGVPPNDFNYGWDGSYKGDIMDAGVYTWFAEVEFVDGEILLYEGGVALVR